MSKHDVIDIITLVNTAMRMPRRLLQHHGAPADVIEQAYRLTAVEGVFTDAAFDLLCPFLPTGPRQQDNMIHAIVDDATDAWPRDKIVIEFDATVWEELGAVADDDLLSPDIFAYLPHPNPFIVFPEPLIGTTRYRDRWHRVVGCFVYGVRPADPSPFLRKQTMRICSTDDPRAVSVALRFVGFITAADGTPMIHKAEWNRDIDVADSVLTLCVVRFDRPVMTFGAIADLIRDMYQDYDHREIPMMSDQDGSASESIEMMRRALAALIYLCCKNADLEIRQPKPQQRAKKARQRSESRTQPRRWVRAGFHMGADIRRWRIEHASASRMSAATGARRKPHQRRSHFHRFRYGPNRSLLSQPRFMPSTWVNSRNCDTEMITVRRVTG